MERNVPERAFHFIVLVPHRDCFPLLEEYRRSLFAAGLAGAFSFPFAVPLALTERPCPGDELKAAAGKLRSLLGAEKLRTRTSREWTAPGRAFKTRDKGMFRLFGPALDPFPDLPSFLAGDGPWEEKPVLVSAVLGPEDTERIHGMAEAQEPGIPAPPEFSFRAAALANLALRPAESGERDYSFTWELGRLYWLPNPRSGN